MAAQKKAKRGWLEGKTTLKVSGNYGTSRGGSRTSNGSVKPHIHAGIDISVPIGTQIKAPFDGTLHGHFNKAGYGLYSVLEGTYGGNKISLKFAHLSESKVGKSGSSSVSEGQVIGKTGGKAGDPNAGNSRGAHLHFEYFVNGVRMHPKYFFSDTLVMTNGSHLSSEDKTVPMIGTKADEQKGEKEDVEVEVSEAQQQADELSDAGETEEIETEEVEKEVSEKLVPGIWQIVKMVEDADVANLMLYDTSVSTQTGPLSSFFNKVCQQPLVEFSGDTFGSQYYFMVRKPPFDKNGMLRTLYAEGITNESIKDEIHNPYVIHSEDIISCELRQDISNVFSWYQLFPVYEMGAQDAQYMIPAVYFPEYATIWGSRNLTVRSQYRTFVGTGSYDSEENSDKNSHADNEVRHAIRDLKYLIESNAYNPFTRSGTIRIRGNRRIKRGTFVVIQTSEDITEVFYVESVANSYGVSMNSVERTTTLTLSHGMVLNFIDRNNLYVKSEHASDYKAGEWGGDEVSYFNLIDFGDYCEDNELNFDNWREVISKWKVNVRVFRFFMQKMQFLYMS